MFEFGPAALTGRGGWDKLYMYIMAMYNRQTFICNARIKAKEI